MLALPPPLGGARAASPRGGPCGAGKRRRLRARSGLSVAESLNAGALRSAPSNSRARVPLVPWLANSGQAQVRDTGDGRPEPTEQNQEGLNAGVARASASAGAHARGQQFLTRNPEVRATPGKLPRPRP